jgi:hypothetical protein
MGKIGSGRCESDRRPPPGSADTSCRVTSSFVIKAQILEKRNLFVKLVERRNYCKKKIRQEVKFSSFHACSPVL